MVDIINKTLRRVEEGGLRTFIDTTSVGDTNGLARSLQRYLKGHRGRGVEKAVLQVCGGQHSSAEHQSRGERGRRH